MLAEDEIGKTNAFNTWKEGGENIGVDFGNAVTLIYIVGLLKGLRALLPAKPDLEGKTQASINYEMGRWYRELNFFQKRISAIHNLLEKLVFNPLSSLAKKVIEPSCAYFFFTISLIPGRSMGLKKNISLRHKEYAFAMNFMQNHSVKLVWGMLALSLVGFGLGIYLATILSSKLAIAAYFIAMFFLSPVLSHLFMGVVAGWRGLWHLLSPMLPFKKTVNDRLHFTYHLERHVNEELRKDPALAASLNERFRTQVATLEQYSYQDGWQVGAQKKGNKQGVALLTSAQLATMQKDLVTKLKDIKKQDKKAKGLKPAALLAKVKSLAKKGEEGDPINNAIEAQEAEFKSKLSVM